jgi:hypothetical protein
LGTSIAKYQKTCTICIVQTRKNEKRKTAASAHEPNKKQKTAHDKSPESNALSYAEHEMDNIRQIREAAIKHMRKEILRLETELVKRNTELAERKAALKKFVESAAIVTQPAK